MSKYYLPTFLLLFPAVMYAQSLQSFATGLLGFLNDAVIPFLLGIGFLFFMINAIRYFVIESADEQGRQKAKNLAIYAVAGFSIIVIFWGVVNLLASSIGLDCYSQPTSDYIDPDSVKNSQRTPCDTAGSGNTAQPSADSQPINENSIVGCILPNGSTEQLRLSECRDANGVTTSTNGTNGTIVDEPSIIERLFDVRERPFRDYFWANWGRGGGSSNNDPDDIDCTFFDPTIGGNRTIQATQEECDAFNEAAESASESSGSDGIEFDSRINTMQ